MDRIEMMRAFSMVAKTSSFTKAAQNLGLSTKVVSNYVRALEDRMQVQLFHRTTRAVSLTEMGYAYLTRCRDILDQVDLLDDLLLEEQENISGHIKLTAPTGFGSRYLAHALAAFSLENTEISIDLHLNDNHVALVEEGIDLAVRIGKLSDSSLIAKKLSDMPLLVCAHPDYLEKSGYPRHPEDLITHHCIIDRNHINPTVWTFSKDQKDMSVHIDGRVQVNTPLAAMNMAKAGLGVIRAPQYTVKDALETGELVSLFPDYSVGMFGIYAIYPPNRHLTRRIRSLIDHLAISFKGMF